METYLQANGTNLTNDAAVRTAAGYFTDSALTWYRLHMNKVETGTAKAWNNWQDVKSDIIRRFQPVEPERSARNKLYTLRQQKSVRAYADAFNQCMLEIPHMLEKDRLEKFLKGLRTDIRVHVQLHRPTTVDEAIDKAIEIDTVLWEANRDNNGQNKTRRQRYDGYRPQHNTPRHPTTSGPAPMELGTVESRRTWQRQHGSSRFPQGRQQPQHGSARPLRCYNCKKLGHKTQECPQKNHNPYTGGNNRPKPGHLNKH